MLFGSITIISNSENFSKIKLLSLGCISSINNKLLFVFKLISLPISILKSIAKLRKRNDSNNGLKPGSVGSPKAGKVDGDNSNGKKENVPVEADSNDNIIPMGENRITEHDESFRDF